MTISKLDKVVALVVVDMQKGIGAPPTIHLASEITERVALLAHAFRNLGLPVGVLVNVAGGAPGRTEASHSFDRPADWTELVPELEQHPRDHTVANPARFRRVPRHIATSLPTPARGDTGCLDRHPDQHWRGIDRRNAHGHGYHVALVVDAMSDLDTDAHRHSVEKIFPLLGETVTTGEVLMLLSRTTVKSTGWSETRA